MHLPVHLRGVWDRRSTHGGSQVKRDHVIHSLYSKATELGSIKLHVWPHSGSMEPMMFRGDLIWIAGTSPESLRVGDVAVYRLPGRDIPIVHRVVSLHQ